jgi:hypothetical protein
MVAAPLPGAPAAKAPPEAKNLEETFPYPLDRYLTLSSRFVAGAAYYQNAYGLEE